MVERYKYRMPEGLNRVGKARQVSVVFAGRDISQGNRGSTARVTAGLQLHEGFPASVIVGLGLSRLEAFIPAVILDVIGGGHAGQRVNAAVAGLPESDRLGAYRGTTATDRGASLPRLGRWIPAEPQRSLRP